MLTTSLLKIPLLVSHAVCTYYGMTLPRIPEEPKLKRQGPDLVNLLRPAHMAAIFTLKYALCGLALAEAAALVAQETPLRDTFYMPSLRLTPSFTTGCLLAIAGGLIRLWCYRSLGGLFKCEVAVWENHTLVTSGPYSVVRHPSYAGWLLMCLGQNMQLLSRGSLFVEMGWWHSEFGQMGVYMMIAWSVWFSVAVLSRMRAEDELMRGEFGPQWEVWAKSTPYQVIPYVY